MYSHSPSFRDLNQVASGRTQCLRAQLQVKGSRTISFLPTWCLPLAHFPLLLQIYMPTVRLSLAILERKREDGIARLYCGFSLHVIGLEGAVDGIKGGGGRERV